MDRHGFADAGEAVEYLKTMVVERRKLEPRRKFLEDHRRIRNRKKLDPYIPFLPGHDQEAWFARLDSNGIWETVFEYLTDPSDVTSAYFSCELFRDRLEEKRKLIMLPKMFGVLRDSDRLKYVGFGRAGYNLRVSDSEEKQEENRDILRQRLVSKAWKKSAEEAFLLNKNLSRPLKTLGYRDWESPMTCRFRNETDVDKAMERLPTAGTCSSLLRLVNVEDEHCSDKEVFYSMLAKFLDIHGSAVWAFRFHQWRETGSGDFNFEALCNLASKMPNLKKLEVGHHYSDLYDGEDIEEDDEYEERARARVNAIHARLTSSVLRNNFPSLPALETFCVHSHPKQNEYLIAEILNKNLNVKTVFLGEWDNYEGETGTPIPTLVWESLRNLQLEYFEFIYDVPGPLFMHDFLQLREFDWPLKYFRVHYSNVQNNSDYTVFEIGASVVFEVMSRYNDTLEEFCFDGFIGVKLVNDGRNVVVGFPNLKKFTLPPVE